MFSNITKKINKNVCLAVSLILTIYFVVIFFVYSFFLLNDFSQKSEHIGRKISQHLTIHCENIKKSVNHSLQINAPEETSYPEIWELLRTCISTNINISSVFFFNDSVSYINANSNQSLIQEYIEFSREHPERLNDSCWNIFTPSESQTPLLCYCVKVTHNNDFLGYLVVTPNIDVYLRNADIFNSSFIQKASIFIGITGSIDCMNIYIPKYQKNNLKFQPIVSQTTNFSLATITLNFPVNEQLYLQMRFSLQNVINSTFPMLCFFIIQFLIILFLCFWGIRKYTSGIEQSLTHLTEQLNDLAESEKETWKENKYL